MINRIRTLRMITNDALLLKALDILSEKAQI